MATIQSAMATVAELQPEDQLSVTAELQATAFVQAYLNVSGGSMDDEDDVDAALSAWFKAASNVKQRLKAQFEPELESETDDEESDEEAAA